MGSQIMNQYCVVLMLNERMSLAVTDTFRSDLKHNVKSPDTFFPSCHSVFFFWVYCGVMPFQYYMDFSGLHSDSCILSVVTGSVQYKFKVLLCLMLRLHISCVVHLFWSFSVLDTLLLHSIMHNYYEFCMLMKFYINVVHSCHNKSACVIKSILSDAIVFRY